MCGIIGEFSEGRDAFEFQKRRDALRHRGPDASGYCELDGGNLKLGHRRLAVIDLSSRSDQPMTIDGYVMVYNGEVYNFTELRRTLRAKCQTTSDTEVILRGYIEQGPEIFSQLNGMFALAIYDPKQQTVILARDRLGIKPLYYYQSSGRFAFASEMSALQVPLQINLNALRRYLYQNYTYGEEEILSGVFRLPPATYGIFDLRRHALKISSYWRPSFSPAPWSLAEATSLLDKVMEQSVADSLISDVPLGVFLSGGNDSALIAALAQKLTGQTRTFTVGFEETSYDESKDAQKLARLLGTNHQTVHLTTKEMVEAVPKILDQFQMPFGDSSAIATYFLSDFVKREVTVCLSGDGADELLGGYPLYYLPKIATIYRHLPFRRLGEKLMQLLPTSTAKMSFDYKLKRFVKATHENYLLDHFAYRSMHQEIDDLMLNPKVQPDNLILPEILADLDGLDPVTALMRLDQRTILPGDYLVKVDMMSMANSLEVRVPFLNNRVVDFSNQLTPAFKVRGLTTKFLLKKTLEKYLPRELIYQKKRGFSVPMAHWLKNELKDFMAETLSPQNIEKTSCLRYGPIAVMMENHWLNRKDYSRELWGLISLVRFLVQLKDHENVNNYPGF